MATKLLSLTSVKKWVRLNLARIRAIGARRQRYEPASTPPEEMTEPTLTLIPGGLHSAADAPPEPSMAVAPSIESTYGSDFLEKKPEDTATGVIFQKALPVDLSGLIELKRSGPTAIRPESEISAEAVWEVQIHGETLGPFTREEILSGLGEGAFPPDILVRERPAQEWREVASLTAVKIAA